MRPLVWLIAAIAIATPCLAQSAPRIGMDITSTTSPLTAQQQATLAAYVDVYIKDLLGDDSARADRARDELVQPLGRPGVSVLFRDEYSRVLVPKLEGALNQQNNHFAPINAMQIAAQLKTDGALSLAMKHVSERDEPRVVVRIWAAKTFNQAAGGLATTNNVLARRVDQATRDLARAAKNETNWLVLLRQLQALGALNTDVARNEERNVLEAITDRMAAQDGPSELVHAVFPAVVSLRDRVIDPAIPPATLTQMCKDLAPILAQVLEVAREHWDEAQQNEDAHSTYGSLVRVTEQTIERIDTIVAPPTQRAPQTQLDESWLRKDKARFEQDVQQWMDRIESSIYQL